MSILDKFKSKFRKGDSSAQTTTQPKRNATDFWRDKLSYLTHVGFILFCGAMAFAVYSLGQYYGQPEPYCLLVSSACIAGLIGHGSAVTRPTSNVSRTMHGVALGTWVVLSVFLASLYMFVSSELLAKYLPDALITTGAIVYSLTFAIGIATSVVALVVPSVAAKKIIGDEFKSLGAAVSKYGETVAILIAIAVSSFHILSFGSNVAKLDVFSVVAAMVMADLAFLAAEKRVVSELKSRADTGRYDRFDLIMWGLFSLFVITYLALVNVYSIRASAGTLDKSDPLFLKTLDFYGASPSILLLMIATLSIVTALIDNRVGYQDDDQDQVRVGVIGSMARWLAQNVVEARQGATVVKQSFTKELMPPNASPALPAPSGTPAAAMGSEGDTLPSTDIKKPRGDTIEGEIGEGQPTQADLAMYLDSAEKMLNEERARREAVEKELHRIAEEAAKKG